MRRRATGFGELALGDVPRLAGRSVVEARVAIGTVFASYVIAVVVGIVTVTSGNSVAIAQRDAVVGAAGSSAITVANRSGDHMRAALLDFGANLALGGMSSTAIGTSVVGLYPVVAYRGWIGGIVVLDGSHRSRLADPASALYYVVTLILQLIPYSIAGGVGVRLGLGAWAQLRSPSGRTTWLGMPTDLMRDALLAYIVIAPLFLLASLWEFLVRV